ncbi:MAG: DUF4249 family protein [Bacteroidota bacterium]
MQISTFRLLLLLLTVSVGFMSCEEEVDWELATGGNEKLVVEAILTDELRFQEVKLSQSYDQLNGEPPAVTDAIVTLSIPGASVNFIHNDTFPGIYRSEIPFPIVDNLDYELTVEWQSEIYTSTSNLSNVYPIPQVTYRQFGNSDNLLVLNEFVPLYHPNQQAMYEVDIIWSHLTGNAADVAKTYFYTFNNVDISQLVRPDRADLPFPRGSIIVVRKFGLNDDFAEYLQALVIETDWTASLFYSNPSSLPTNISNDGLGFFSTCAVLTEILIAL